MLSVKYPTKCVLHVWGVCQLVCLSRRWNRRRRRVVYAACCVCGVIWCSHCQITFDIRKNTKITLFCNLFAIWPKYFVLHVCQWTVVKCVFSFNACFILLPSFGCQYWFQWLLSQTRLWNDCVKWGMRPGAAIIGGRGDTSPQHFDPLTRGSAPGLHWGLRPQTPVPHHSEEIAATAWDSVVYLTYLLRLFFLEAPLFTLH